MDGGGKTCKGALTSDYDRERGSREDHAGPAHHGQADNRLLSPDDLRRVQREDDQPFQRPGDARRALGHR